MQRWCLLMQRWCLQYLELVLTALGLAICLVLIARLPANMDDKWQVVAVVAIVIGVTHGLIFYGVRSRQRAVRLQAIQDVAYLLQERMTTYIRVVNSLSNSPNLGHQQMLHRAKQDMTSLLDSLSEDSLVSWEKRNQSLQQPPSPPPPKERRED